MNDTEHRIETMIQAARDQRWPGTDHHERVDQFLKEQHMTQTHRKLSRTTVALIAAGLLGGGAVSAAVTHQVLSHRAQIVAEDGTVYDVELTPTPVGASGVFVTDTGTVYGIEMIEDENHKEVTVEVDSATGGMTTVNVDGASPRVLVAPGQTASVKIETIKDDDSSEDPEGEAPSSGD